MVTGTRMPARCICTLTLAGSSHGVGVQWRGAVAWQRDRTGLWICVFVCFCICVFVYLQWCWYPVEEEQLHRKSTRTGRRRKQPSPAAPEPKLLKLSPKSLLFPTFTGFLHSSALFYIKHNYTRERQWIAADFFQRRAIKSSDTKITDRTSHWKLHLIEHMILQKNISENII